MRWLRLAGALALVVGVYFTVPISDATDRGGLVQLGIAGAGVAVLTALVVWQLRAAERPGRRIDGLLLALVVGVLGFALGYASLEQHDPGQVAGLETRLDALYFTMATLLTIGYGDVHPAGQAARALAVVQMLFNVVVLATAATTIGSRVRSAAVGRRTDGR
jgi:hypothetical protein